MKYKSSKLVAFILTFIVLLSQTLFSSPVSAADKVANAETEKNIVPVTIFHTNDMHGRLAHESYKGTSTSYGVAREKALIEKEKKENPERTTFILDAGDAFQGLPISNESKGEDMAKAMNKIGYDAMTAGNHEFDFGYNVVKKYGAKDEKTGQVDTNKWLNFPIVSSNITKDGKPAFDAYTIIKKDGLTVGIVGVTTPETKTKSNPTGLVGVEFSKPIPAVKNAIKEIKDKVDFVTVLAHLGDDTTTLADEKGSTLAKALSEDPAFARLSILIIDGHSHQVIQNDFNQVHQAQTGSYLANVGKITFDFDKANKKFVNYKSVMLSAKENAGTLEPNKELEDIVKTAQDNFNKKGKEFLFHNNTILQGESTNVRTKETNLGNAIADALYMYKGFTHDSDFAVTNGGGIRTTLNKDLDITLGDVIKVLPFGNQLTQIKVKGSDIKAMYEHSLRAAIDIDKATGKEVIDAQGKPQLGSNGGFLHSSSSIKVAFDPHKKAGERVYSIKILNKQSGKFENIDPNKDYYMATNDFLAVGGDGYTMLGGVREESGFSMDRVVADYLKTANLDKYAVEFPYSRILPNLTPVKPVAEAGQFIGQDDFGNYFVYSTGLPEINEVPEAKIPSNNQQIVKHTSVIQKNTPELPKTGLETTSSIFGVGLLATIILVIFRKKISK